MIERIIIAGAGGQGIMVLGKILAEAAMRENKYLTWFPSYGAEVRGGAAHCMVVISDRQISSPHIDKADILIVMNGPSLTRFKSRIRNRGLLIINASLAAKPTNKNIDILSYPFTDIAASLGNIKIANVVALGCLIAHKKIVKAEAILNAISGLASGSKKNLIEINRKALREGMRL